MTLIIPTVNADIVYEFVVPNVVVNVTTFPLRETAGEIVTVVPSDFVNFKLKLVVTKTVLKEKNIKNTRLGYCCFERLFTS